MIGWSATERGAGHRPWRRRGASRAGRGARATTYRVQPITERDETWRGARSFGASRRPRRRRSGYRRRRGRVSCHRRTRRCAGRPSTSGCARTGAMSTLARSSWSHIAAIGASLTRVPVVQHGRWKATSGQRAVFARAPTRATGTAAARRAPSGHRVVRVVCVRRALAGQEDRLPAEDAGVVATRPRADRPARHAGAWKAVEVPVPRTGGIDELVVSEDGERRGERVRSARAGDSAYVALSYCRSPSGRLQSGEDRITIPGDLGVPAHGRVTGVPGAQAMSPTALILVGLEGRRTSRRLRARRAAVPGRVPRPPRVVAGAGGPPRVGVGVGRAGRARRGQDARTSVGTAIAASRRDAADSTRFPGHE